MTFSALSGAPVLGIMCAAFLAAGAAVARTWRRDETPTEIALDALLAGMALAILTVSTLAVTGLASPHIVVALALTLGALALGLRGRAVLDDARTSGLAALHAVARSPVLWTVVLLALFTLASGLALPPLAPDALALHLPIAASWLRHAGVVRLEGGGVWETFDAAPKGSAALLFLAMAPFGRDYLVNLVGVPMWLGLGLAVRAASRRLGVPARASDLAVLAVLASPDIFGRLTSADTALPRGFAFAAMLATAARALDRRDPLPLRPLGLALGIGLAVSFDAWCWLPLACLAVCTVLRARPRRATRDAVLGLTASILVALPWYARNLQRCDNPIYPFALPPFTDGPRAGALHAWWNAAPRALIREGLHVLIDAVTTPPWHQAHRAGPSWLCLAALLVAFASPWFTEARTRARALVLALIAAYLTLFAIVVPDESLHFDAGARFFGPPFIIAVVGVAASLATAAPLPSGVLSALTILCILPGLASSSTLHALRALSPGTWLAACVGFALLCATRAAHAPTPVHARRWWLASTLFFVAAWLTLPGSLSAREARRFDSYRDAHALGPASTTDQIIWQFVSSLPPGRIALAADHPGAAGTPGNAGTDPPQWFFYPLFGADLRHTVTYVGIERDDRWACRRRGAIRDAPDLESWLGRIRLEHIDHVVVRGSPVEDAWMRARPERFWLRVGSAHTKVYQVLPARQR